MQKMMWFATVSIFMALTTVAQAAGFSLFPFAALERPAPKPMESSELTAKLYGEAKTQWGIFFQAEKGNQVEPLSQGALFEASQKMDTQFTEIQDRYADTSTKQRNDWGLLTELNSKAKDTWQTMLECTRRKIANPNDIDKLVDQVRDDYRDMKLCPEAKQKLASLKQNLDEFLSSTLLEPPNSKSEKYGDWIFKGGLQFQPLLIQLAAEDISVGFHYPDLAECTGHCNRPTSGLFSMGFKYDVAWWKPLSQHHEAAFFKKVNNAASLDGGIPLNQAYDLSVLDQSDPEVLKFIRAVNASMLMTLLRKSESRQCAQWGLWPQKTFILFFTVGGWIGNVHGLGVADRMLDSTTVSKDCEFNWQPDTNQYTALMIATVNAHSWSAMAEFHSKELAALQKH